MNTVNNKKNLIQVHFLCQSYHLCFMRFRLWWIRVGSDTLVPSLSLMARDTRVRWPGGWLNSL